MDRARCNGCATHGDSRFTAFPPRQCELTFGTWPHRTTKSEARFASRCRDAGDELRSWAGSEPNAWPTCCRRAPWSARGSRQAP